MTTLALGVVGCRGMGTTHADAIEATEGADLVAGVDLKESVATSFAESYDCEGFASHEAMLAEMDVDAVSVCTPNGTHAEIVVDCAEAGVDVLCEKPLETTSAKLDRLIDACTGADVTLGGIFQRRTFGEARRAKRAVEEGELGEPVVATAAVRWHGTAEYYEGWHGSADLDGGILMTQAIHAIDWLEWIVDDVARVSAAMDSAVHDVDAPDTAVCSLEFADGTYGQLVGTTGVYPHYPLSVAIRGTRGTVEIYEGGVETFETQGEAALDPVEDHPLGRGHLGQVRDFVRAISEGREPMIPPADARSAADVALAAEASADRDTWVDLTEFRP